MNGSMIDEGKKTIIGIVEKVEYAQGSRGNQWTHINGECYCTFFDWAKTDWKVGDMVSCEVSVLRQTNYIPCLYARDIKKFVDEQVEPPPELENPAPI